MPTGAHQTLLTRSIGFLTVLIGDAEVATSIAGAEAFTKVTDLTGKAAPAHFLDMHKNRRSLSYVLFFQFNIAFQ